MNDELITLQNKVNEVIYNPFVNLKTQIKQIKKTIGDNNKYKAEVIRLDAAFNSLDEFENLPYGNLERIKGFNKIKSNTLKIIKDLLSLQDNSSN